MLDDKILEHLEIIRDENGLIFKSCVTGEKLTAIPKKAMGEDSKRDWYKNENT